MLWEARFCVRVSDLVREGLGLGFGSTEWLYGLRRCSGVAGGLRPRGGACEQGPINKFGGVGRATPWAEEEGKGCVVTIG